MKEKKNSTSWESVQDWYKRSVGDKGQHYHKEVIFPRLTRYFAEQGAKSLLDLGCGSGVMERHVPSGVRYCGVDLSRSLVSEAKKRAQSKHHKFLVADITKPLELDSADFEAVSVILALQNLESPVGAFANAHQYLTEGGRLYLVMNHPCFRIPRQSFWHLNSEKKSRARCIERYMSSMKIPIQAHPSQGKQSPVTWSFHHPLSSYFKWLQQEGFYVETMEEWCSDKQSQGKYAKGENRSRAEIPLFLFLVARKLPGKV